MLKVTLHFRGRFVTEANQPIAGATIFVDGKPLPQKTTSQAENLDFTLEVDADKPPVIRVQVPGSTVYTFTPSLIKTQIAKYLSLRKSNHKTSNVINLGTKTAKAAQAAQDRKAERQIPEAQDAIVSDAPTKKTLADVEKREELETLSIAHVDLKIPPTSILLLQENQIDNYPVLRSNGVQLKNGGQDRTLVVNLFFQADGSGVMPLEFMRLLAMAEVAPFVPIENLYLNILLDVQAVGIMGYTLESVEGAPMGFNLQLILKEFNFRAYLPYADSFAEQFDMKLFQWYVDHYIEKRWGAPVDQIQAAMLQADVADRSRLKIRYKSLSDAQKIVDNVQNRERGIRDLMRGYDYGTYSCRVTLGSTNPEFKKKLQAFVKEIGKERALNTLFGEGIGGNIWRLGQYLDDMPVEMTFDSYFPNLSEGKLGATFADNHRGSTDHKHGQTVVRHSSFPRLMEILIGVTEGSLMERFGPEFLDQLLETGMATLYLLDFRADPKTLALNLTSKPQKALKPRQVKDLQGAISALMQRNLGSELASEFLFEQLIITKVRISHENVMAVQTPTSATSSCLQFLGRMPKRISLTLRTENLEELMNLSEVLGTLNAQLQAFHSAAAGVARGDGKGQVDSTYSLPGEALPEILSIGVINPFLNSLGLKDVMVQRFTISTIPEQPGDFEIGLEMSSFDHTQRRAEEIVAPVGQQNVKSGTEFNSAEENLRLLEEELCTVETYPDLYLPTYDELAAMGVKLERAPLAYGLRYKNKRLQPTFVDPDFYIKPSYEPHAISAMIKDMRGNTLIKTDKATPFGAELYDLISQYQPFPAWQMNQFNQTLKNTIRENFQERSRLVSAFPTFYLAFRTEDEDLFWWKNFGEFYGFRGLIAAELHESRDLPASVLKLTLSNLYNNLFKISGNIDKGVLDRVASSLAKQDELAAATNGTFPTLLGLKGLLQFLSNTSADFATKSKGSNFGENSRPGAAGTAAEHGVTAIYLQAGARLHFRLGYGANASQLIPKFNGVITDLMPGPQTVVLCQGDGTELNRVLTTHSEETGVPFMWGDAPHLIIYNLLSEQYGNPINPAAGGLMHGAMTVVRNSISRLKAENGVPLGTISHFGNALPWYSYVNGRFDSTIVQNLAGGVIGAVVVTALGLAAGRAAANLFKPQFVAPVVKVLGGTSLAIGGGLLGANLTDSFMRTLYVLRRTCADFFDTEIFKRYFPNCTAFDNIYSVHGTGNWLEALGKKEGQPGGDGEETMDTGGYIKIPLKGKTTWEVIKICEMTAPEYIAAVHPFGTRSTVFFGLPFWDITIATPTADAQLETYDNCGYDLFSYQNGNMDRVSRSGAVPKVTAAEQLAMQAAAKSARANLMAALGKDTKRPPDEATVSSILQYYQKSATPEHVIYALGLMHMKLADDFSFATTSVFGLCPTIAKDFGLADYQEARPQDSIDVRVWKELAYLDRLLSAMEALDYTDASMCRAFHLGRKLNDKEQESGSVEFMARWGNHVMPAIRAMKGIAKDAGSPSLADLESAEQSAEKGYGGASLLLNIMQGIGIAFDVAFVLQVIATLVVTAGGAAPAVAVEAAGAAAMKQAVFSVGERVIAREVLEKIAQHGVSKFLGKWLMRAVGPKSLRSILIQGAVYYGGPALFDHIKPWSEGSTAAAGAASTHGQVYYKAKRPFRSIWMFDTYSHVLDNQIFATGDQVYTDVVCNYDGGATTVHADVNIYAHLRKTKEVTTPVSATMANGSFLPSRWYAKNVLKDSMMRMYQGNVTIIGQPLVKPHDTILLQDHYTDMQGPINVRSVTHVFGAQTGLSAVVTPDLVVYTAGNNMEQIHVWLWAIHTATMLFMSTWAVGATWSWASKKFARWRVKDMKGLLRVLKRSPGMMFGSAVKELKDSSAAIHAAGFSPEFEERLGKLLQKLGIKEAEAAEKTASIVRTGWKKGHVALDAVVRGAKASPKLLKAAPVRFMFAFWAVDGIFDTLNHALTEFLDRQAVRMCPLTINGQALQSGMAGSIGLMTNIEGEIERADQMITGYRNLDTMIRFASLIIHAASPVPFYETDEQAKAQIAAIQRDLKLSQMEREERIRQAKLGARSPGDVLQDDLRSAAAQKNGKVVSLVNGLTIDDTNLSLLVGAPNLSHNRVHDRQNVARITFPDGGGTTSRVRQIQVPADKAKYLESNSDWADGESTHWIRLKIATGQGPLTMVISHLRSLSAPMKALIAEAQKTGKSVEVPLSTLIGLADRYVDVSLQDAKGTYVDPRRFLSQADGAYVNSVPKGVIENRDQELPQRPGGRER